MKDLKKYLIIVVLILLGLLDILIYRNNHLCYKTEKVENNETKIKILEGAVDFYPSNDLVFYELGRAYLDLGISKLDENSGSQEYLQKSIRSYRKSLRSNPASYYGHFYLAQSLLYVNYLLPPSDINPHDEFKLAASLAGENSEIFFEVAKIFLSRWAQLSDDDRHFTLEILRKVVRNKDLDRIRTILSVWEMNVKNYSIIENILPEDWRVYRLYAEFLGEKSLSAEARQRSLAKAEYLEFQEAREKQKAGEKEFFSFRLGEAFDHFISCLRFLNKIRFYQNLASPVLINVSEFLELKKSALLYLAKCCIEQGKELDEVEGYLQSYLALENDLAAVEEIESYLKIKGIIPEKLETNPRDLNDLFFQLLLSFNQDHHKNIMELGRHLKQSIILIPEPNKEIYVQILNLIGDSFQKIGQVYDAGDFYNKALEIDPNNLETLIRIRRYHEKLGSDEEVQKINEKIDEVLSPKEKTFRNYSINKGRLFTRSFVFDGEKKVIGIHFDFHEEENKPLISVFFNDRVVWEDFLNGKTLSLFLETKIGQNILRVIPLNREVILTKLDYH